MSGVLQIGGGSVGKRPEKSGISGLAGFSKRIGATTACNGKFGVRSDFGRSASAGSSESQGKTVVGG